MKKKIIYAVIVIIVIVAGIIFLVKNKKCTVNIHTSGGTLYPAEQIKCGEKIKKPADPKLEGYRFIGWYIDDKEFDFDTPITKDTTITAKYELIK